jgi:hypothetical protein
LYVTEIILQGGMSLFRRMTGGQNGEIPVFTAGAVLVGMIIDFVDSDTSSAPAALTMITTANGSAQADPWFLKGGDDSRPGRQTGPLATEVFSCFFHQRRNTRCASQHCF